MEDLEEIIGFDALFKSMYKCKSGVLWKNSVARYYTHGIEETIKLEEQLKNGTYEPKPPKKFLITHPKQREAISIHFRDRVYQRSINDNYLYPTMTKGFIADNFACQKGKGTDKARERLDEFLHKFYRKNKLNGYVLQCDIKGYYPNMSHEIVEQMFEKKINGEIKERTFRVLREQYDGEVGYNPGSQMVQITGISLLNGLDHFIKERLRCKLYLRYMDDFIIISEDKQYLQKCKEEIGKYLSDLQFTLHPKKTRIYDLKQGIMFLGFRHKLTDTGKVLRLINPENVKAEKRKLRKMVELVAQGKMTEAKLNMCYNSWKSHANNGNSFLLIQKMDKYLKDLKKEILNERRNNCSQDNANL